MLQSQVTPRRSPRIQAIEPDADGSGSEGEAEPQPRQRRQRARSVPRVNTTSRITHWIKETVMLSPKNKWEFIKGCIVTAVIWAVWRYCYEYIYTVERTFIQRILWL